MNHEFDTVKIISNDDTMESLEVNEVAVQIMQVDFNTSANQTYMTQLSFLNRKFSTNFTMDEFIKTIEKAPDNLIRHFVENFIAYFKDKTSADQLSLSLHTLYVYSLSLIPRFEQKFNYVTQVSSEDSMEVLEVNEEAIQILQIDLKTLANCTYTIQLSDFNSVFYTNFTMDSFIEIIKKVHLGVMKKIFMPNFIAYFNDKTSIHEFSLLLHKLYAYSLDFFPKRSMVIRQSLYHEDEAIIFRVEAIDQEVYAFTKGFLKVLFETEKELDYEFLLGLIDDLKLAIKFSNYYKTGTTENPAEIQEYLNNYTNE